ncbi:hypothetical protein SAMN05444851_1227 [Aliiroseovarius sediminilitoris]|uniref:Uncharacterized protein n=1 Tax=Aliiroseovarius sediminilitoris TaxID=1173584 RepID=A0A1I0NZD2_9RHOB|nr:hypothetical protein SAMN05444851_1227 [Aliiroseovarius sediminilitoris]
MPGAQSIKRPANRIMMRRRVSRYQSVQGLAFHEVVWEECFWKVLVTHRTQEAAN